jgi:hypothetical protein
VPAGAEPERAVPVPDRADGDAGVAGAVVGSRGSSSSEWGSGAGSVEVGSGFAVGVFAAKSK